MAANILFLNMVLVSSKCLFQVWLFHKGVIDDKMAMVAMRWRIFICKFMPLNDCYSFDLLAE